MKRTFIIFTAITYILSYAGCIKAFSLSDKPKIGVELGHRKITWEQGFGKDHFAESLPQLDLFIEVPIFKQFSVKFGHTTTTKRKALATYQENDFVLGSQVPEEFTFIYATAVKHTANYLDLAYNYTIFKQPNYQVGINLFLGCARGKLDISHQELIYQFPREKLTPRKKVYFRKGFSIQTALINGISFNLGIAFEKTSKFTSTRLIYGDNDNYYKTVAKNSTIYRVGFTYQI